MTKKNYLVTILLIVAVVIFCALSVVFGILFSKQKAQATSYEKQMDSVYEKTYFDTIDNMKDIETKLGKVSVLSSATLQQQYLYEIWKQSTLSVTNLSILVTDNEELEQVMKFLNQMGEYCFYLSRKNHSLTEAEQENIQKFKTLLSKINTDLFSVTDKFGEGEKLDTHVISQIENLSSAIHNYSDIDYPELIYDGPFSEGLSDRTALFLQDKEPCSEGQCVEKLKRIFPSASNIQRIGETTTSIETYLFSFDYGGKPVTAQMSKKGGYLTEYNSYSTTTNPTYSESICIQKATDFLTQIGYENMECVWTYNDNSTLYLNFAYAINNVICYADLIKIKVNTETAEILSLEGQNYLYNHTSRQIPSTKRDITVSERINVESTRDCFIPTEWNTEIYCKEVCGTVDGQKFYLYYDFESGEEIQAFAVIDDLLV